MQVWVDQKRHIRKKAAENYRYREGTGGGPPKKSRLSSTEEAIYEIVKMKQSVEGVEGSNTFGAPLSSSENGNETVKIVNNDIEIDEDPSPHTSNAQKSLKTPKKSESTSKLIEAEVKNQIKLNEKISELVDIIKEDKQETKSMMKRMVRSLEKIGDVKAKKLKQIERHHAEMEKYRRSEMASLAATNWPKPLVLVPCLSWSTAATVFTTGVMSQSINWDMLETQYYSDGKYSERLSKMVTVIDDAFMAGQIFIRNFNQSIIELEKDIQNTKTGKLHDANNAFPEDNENSRSLTRLMKFILPNINSDNKINVTKINWWEREALQFMRGMMDECTHLKNFSVPKETSLVIAVCAKDDAYVPREGCSGLEEIWPGVEVRYLDAGHVSAYVLHQKLFRSCIIEAFERAKKFDTQRDVPCDKLTYHQLLEKYVNTM